MEQLPFLESLRPYFPEDQQQLLDLTVIAWQHKPDDCHEQVGKVLTVQDHLDSISAATAPQLSPGSDLCVYMVCVCGMSQNYDTQVH